MSTSTFGFMAWLTAVVGVYLAYKALEMVGHPNLEATIILTFGIAFVSAGCVLMGRRQMQRQIANEGGASFRDDA